MERTRAHGRSTSAAAPAVKLGVAPAAHKEVLASLTKESSMTNHLTVKPQNSIHQLMGSLTKAKGILLSSRTTSTTTIPATTSRTPVEAQNAT